MRSFDEARIDVLEEARNPRFDTVAFAAIRRSAWADSGPRLGPCEAQQWDKGRRNPLRGLRRRLG